MSTGRLASAYPYGNGTFGDLVGRAVESLSLRPPRKDALLRLAADWRLSSEKKCKLLQRALAKGADVNVQDERGYTVGHVFIAGGDVEAFNIVLPGLNLEAVATAADGTKYTVPEFASHYDRTWLVDHQGQPGSRHSGDGRASARDVQRTLGAAERRAACVASSEPFEHVRSPGNAGNVTRTPHPQKEPFART